MKKKRKKTKKHYIDHSVLHEWSQKNKTFLVANKPSLFSYRNQMAFFKEINIQTLSNSISRFQQTDHFLPLIFPQPSTFSCTILHLFAVPYSHISFCFLKLYNVSERIEGSIYLHLNFNAIILFPQQHCTQRQHFFRSWIVSCTILIYPFVLCQYVISKDKHILYTNLPNVWNFPVSQQLVVTFYVTANVQDQNISGWLYLLTAKLLISRNRFTGSLNNDKTV